MKRKIHKWTDAEDKVIIGLYEDGVKIKDIAALFYVTPKTLNAKVYNLRKKGLIKSKRSFNWTPEAEKDLVKILQKNEGNLREGFRQFADKYNCDWTIVSSKYYSKHVKNGRIKDKYPIFGVFGRYRAASNSKVYVRQNAKGHTLWNTIKGFFKF